MYSTTQLSLLACQLAALQVRYPDLDIEQCRSGLSVRGDISFAMTHKTHTIEDTFGVELRIPVDYPKTPPSAYETKGRLNEFEHVFVDGRLCLGAPVEVCMRFAKEPTLLFFIEDLVVPFLFGFSYKDKYGEMPFGELAHGVEGLLAYYVEFFQTSKEGTISLLLYLAYGGKLCRGDCPCGSGRKLEKCHGPRLDTLWKYQAAEAFKDDLKRMTTADRMIGESRRKLLPRRLRRKLEKELNLSDRLDRQPARAGHPAHS